MAGDNLINARVQAGRFRTATTPVGDYARDLNVDDSGNLLISQSSLIARLGAGIPSSANNKLAYDTASTTDIYILEAPIGTADNSPGWQGIRYQLDASGNILGDVQINQSATLTFNNRATDPGWTS